MPRLFNSAKHTLFVLFILIIPFSLFCQNAWSETITGRVTLLDTSTGLAGICVTAFSDKCNQNEIDDVTTDENGDYTLTVPADSQVYIVANGDCSPTTKYDQRWYDGGNGTYDCNAATFVSEGSTANFLLSPTGSVSGTVSEADGKIPIGNLIVVAQSDACNGSTYGRAVTDASGNYTINAIPVGTVSIGAYPIYDGYDGFYLHQNYMDEWYDGNCGTRDCTQAAKVQVAENQVTPEIDFHLSSSIFELQYVHNPDGSFKLQYFLEFYPLNNFTPDSVVSIHLTDPSGNVIKTYTRQDGVQGYGDFEYVDQWKMFQAASLNITPELGEYTFTVVTDTFTAIVKRQKTLNRVIPVPDATQMQPVDNAILTSKTPIFNWAPVHIEGVDLFYRIQIYDQTGYRVFKSNREKNLLSIVIPENILTPGQTYEWTVDICDIDNWEILENRANSATLSFTMADTPAHANIPAMKIDGWRAVAYHTSDYDATECWIEVIDHDGVAYDGSSHQVSVTYNGETHPVSFVRTLSPISGAYEYWGNAPAPAGDYVFTVIDPDDNTGTLTDTLVVDILPSPDESTFAVNINGTTPTFTWDTVPGAARYRVRIYNLDGSTAWKGYPETLPAPSCTVPPGVLQPNTHYNYRIEAWDGHSGLDIDNVSKSPASNSNNPEFQTGEETTAPFVDPDAHGAYTWDNIVTGPYLSFWTKIHDAKGVPSNIKSVKVIFPDDTEIPLYLKYTESSTCGIYINDSFALPVAPGNYTITVEDLDGNISSHTDLLDVNSLGYPSEESITAVFNETQGDFTWDLVPGAAFYRLEIYDMDFNRLYTFATTTNSYHVPAGILKQNTFYRYRITTRREFFDQGVDNGSSSNSQSRMKTFFTTPALGTAMPSIDLNKFGAFVIHSQKAGTSDATFWLEFEVMVRDQDGVPDNISTVQVVYPDNTTTRDLRLNSSVEPDATQGVYGYYETYDTSQEIQPGIYVFTVTDAAGKIATITDSLVIDSLPIPTNYTPAHGSSVGSTTPVISWDPVPAATRYRLRIYKNWNDKIHDINNLITNAYTIPANVLGINNIYNYRISAYKDIEGQDVDNMSINRIFTSERPHFTISPATTGDINGDGSIDLSDALLAMKIMTGRSSNKTICLAADVNQDGKIGLAEMLYIYQQISQQ
jgi:hypothetical protein